MESVILAFNAVSGALVFILLANLIPFSVMAFFIVRSINKESK